ncbi:Fe-S cluster assembly protein SufD [Streptococcus sp. X16XC17]|uniref:Fe-S cluster assembly protein SufD n=1 Tax=unclassified Streptococcus TaxID=2608887 RepID=UPI00066FF856|nr:MULTISPECIES: Fe-S cluster assembly protein SufD [unclassified Streptococcus]TCD45610.1 Fe-S cluster assembly protein SufD [Streptococcus sp. X16XC17]
MSKQDILAFSQTKGEPIWLQDLRLSAFEKIAELDLPAIERVKFHRWNLGDGTLAESDFAGNIPDFTALGDNPKLVQVGTQTVLEQLPMELINQGVIFIDFHSALEEIPQIIEQHFGTAVSYDEDKLAAYNYACFNSAAVLYVPDNVEIDQPIEGIFLQDSDSALPFNKHILIVAGKNSSFSYLERFESIGQGQVEVSANISVEVIAQAGSQIKFSAIDRLGEHVTAYMSRRARHANDATVDWALGVMNEGNVIADFDSDLIGNGSRANLKVVAASSGRQIQGIDTRVTNYGQHSIGHILQHGVILERGTLTFNGIGHIVKGAKGADAQQESRVLMLSDKARSDANPILLIDENEVTAGHAASIGQVDPEDMYYLMSRGIDQSTAERLVIHGFLGTVITEIPVKEVRDEMVDVLDSKLDKR